MMAAVPHHRSMDDNVLTEAHRQWKARRWAAPAAMTATMSIMRAQQLVVACAEEALRPFDLTFARYEALVQLAFSREGALPLGELSRRLMVHPTSVTSIVDRLEQQGLVRRTGHPTDRRTTLADITEDGRRTVDKASEAVSATSFGMAALSERELEQLTGLLRKVCITGESHG